MKNVVSARPLKRMARHAWEAWEVPRDLLLGRYPDFVTGSPLARGEVPVFVFHSLEPVSFERKLRHLADNGYVTLGMEEYYHIVLNARRAPERAILLTFDDGRASVWTVGLPAMKRYGFKGIVFLVPGRVPNRPLRPTMADVREGRAVATDVIVGGDPEEGFLSWEEIEALNASGLFEFQSHTFTHARVHVAPEVAGFLTPKMLRGYQAMDVPWIHEWGVDLTADEVALGTPLLRSAPRTAEAWRFYEEPEFRRISVDTVAQHGPGFFALPDWEDRLRACLKDKAIPGRMETAEERERAIGGELERAKTTIEERTGKPVLHLCYPWHASGPTARRIAKELGYRTAFCGKVPGVPITPPGGDPLSIARIGEDYVELLPGKGRRTLTSVLLEKWKRRSAGG
jgi:peptidoglycan/xylan/chitin deacetylase (PgdA/CDA1 family)